MMKKTEIFQHMLQILSNDYAGFEEKKACLNEQPKITDTMTELQFLKAVKGFLSNFNDGHLAFVNHSYPLPFCGFTVRRYDDALYVTHVFSDERLQKGDRIVALDDVPIKEAAYEYKSFLQSNMNERQLWNNVLPYVQTFTVERGNALITLTAHHFEQPPYEPEYSLQKINAQTALIKLTDFSQEEPIVQLLHTNEHYLNTVDTILFDVRINKGGNDLFYFPLLSYAIDAPISTKDIAKEDEYSFTNYTKNNCDFWIQSLKGYLQQPLDTTTRFIIENEIVKYEANYGIGLVKNEDLQSFSFEPKGNARKIYILSDITNASSGESFIKNMRLSDKVTVVGRGTMGILDYYNQTEVQYGDYTFYYSISKLNPPYYKNETGELPDLHIPWTPQHLQEDVDLNRVLKEINQKTSTIS